MRLSLAGAQWKWGVVIEPNGGLAEPASGLPSTHILKIGNPAFPGLVTLEAFGLRLAAAVQLPVASASLFRSGSSEPALLVKRYDREVHADGTIDRIHQEDLCQAFGLPPEHKYQQHGGPSLERAFALLRHDLGTGPRALQALLRWVIVNVILGNADAHGKNVSLLRLRDGTVALAPFYDLVPTCALPMVDRAFAMPFGRALTVDAFEPHDWVLLAEVGDFRPSFVRSMVNSTTQLALRALDRVAADLIDEGGEPKVLRRVAEITRQRSEALLKGAPMPLSSAPKSVPTGAWGAWGMSL